MKIAGAVVLYNPDKDVIENFKTYLPLLECLYVVDNSTKELDFLQQIKDVPKVKYISLNGNKGIAKALKVASEKAIEEGYDWLLTMDQDSKYPTNDFEYIKNFIENEDMSKIGTVGLNYDGSKIDIKSPDKSQHEFVNSSISSGMLINIDNYKKIDGFKEDLFIDLVDCDLCLQFLANGFKNVSFLNIALDHKLGEKQVVKFLFYKKERCSHSPLRYYYYYRNYHYLKKYSSKEYLKYLKNEAKNFTFIHSIGSAMLEKEHFKTWKMIRRGIKDGKKGVLGPYEERRKK